MRALLLVLFLVACNPKQPPPMCDYCLEYPAEIDGMCEGCYRHLYYGEPDYR